MLSFTRNENLLTVELNPAAECEAIMSWCGSGTNGVGHCVSQLSVDQLPTTAGSEANNDRLTAGLSRAASMEHANAMLTGSEPQADVLLT